MLRPLPIDAHLPQIIQRLREARALVLVAEPGAGKTTRVPPAILRSGMLDGEHPNLVMLQPRRVAARAAAMRIAVENGWRIGEEVGWHVRFDRRVGQRTRLRVLTEGILTRQLIDDPFLEGVGAVMLDEFHERSIHTDLTIALLREVRQTVRDDLMLIVMSATLDAEPVARFLGGCPVVQVPGRAYPIDVQHAAPSAQPLHARVAAAVAGAVEDATGDVLVFLPGVAEINRAARELSAAAHRRDLRVLPLHGSLPPEEQQRAIERSDRRKVVLATNIAETSLTIDGVNIVIDSGLARIAGYDAERGLDRLDLRRISKASAIQRAGRAGRTAPGRCLRLYTAREFHAMSEFELPEIHRVDLASTVLALHAWGKPDPRSFGWYDSPPEEALRAAEGLLAMLGALDADENARITELGRQMVKLPVHPRLARLLIAASEEGMLEAGATIAALLSEKDIAPIERGPDRSPIMQADSDLVVRLDLAGTSPQIQRLRDELVRIGRTIKAAHRRREQDVDEAMLRLALVGYPDRVCRRRATDPSAGVMVGGGGVRLAPESVVRRHEFFVAMDARQDDRSAAREAIVKIASGVEVDWLEEVFPQAIRRQRRAVYDPQRDRVVGHGTVCYYDLVLREDKDAAVDPREAARVLAEWARPRALELARSEEAIARWLDRLTLLRKAMPDKAWPKPGDALLGDAIGVAAQGKRSIAELRAALLPVLQGLLEYPLDRLLDTEAPETIEAPSGSRIRLQYPAQNDQPGDIQPPVLAVRLQELFGWTETPRIAGGRVPVIIHLLGPNFRPVQVTSDLRSFWKTTYFDVRKDLRVRYPRHAWPEDPLTAKPEAKGGRRR